MKHFGTIFFSVAMFFLAYILIADTPIERLNRSCLPVTWSGRAVTAVASLGSAGAEARAANGVQQAFYTCRFLLYRQFYQEDYARLVAAQKPQAVPEKGPVLAPAQADARDTDKRGARP